MQGSLGVSRGVWKCLWVCRGVWGVHGGCLGVFGVCRDVRFHFMLNTGHFGAPSVSLCFHPKDCLASLGLSLVFDLP